MELNFVKMGRRHFVPASIISIDHIRGLGGCQYNFSATAVFVYVIFLLHCLLEVY